MKILKYKKKANGKYSVFLDDGREFVYYEDTILQYNLLIKKEIDEKELLKIYQTNLEFDVYYVALNSIKSRYKSVFELSEFLRKKNYPEDLIDKAIQRLIQQKYLDDRSFVKSFIHTQIHTTNHGPNHIKKDLIHKGIDTSIIDQELVIYDETLQMEKIDKIIQKKLKSNHSKGGNVLKQKIVNELIMEGFDYDIVSRIISDYHFNNNEDLAKKEYEKYYKKYSKKYSGEELIYRIREKMYQKGLTYEEK